MNETNPVGSNMTDAEGSSSYSLLATAVSGIIVGGALIFLAYVVGRAPEVYPITYLICLSGYIIGWILGIMSSPMNSKDESQINRFAKLIGAFLSGYLLSKLDKILEIVLHPDVALKPLAGARILLFICCLGLTFILVFYYRRYKWRFSR